MELVEDINYVERKWNQLIRQVVDRRTTAKHRENERYKSRKLEWGKKLLRKKIRRSGWG